VKPAVIAACAGAVFALGLVVAGMTDPARVTGFLDVTGRWDGSLAFVMAGAILVYAPIARLARSRSQPLLAAAFHWPARSGIDVRLVGGAAIFGVGWGLSGYCPGPALASLATGEHVLVFAAAVIAGTALARLARPSAA
jgi:uncharacterized protein